MTVQVIVWDGAHVPDQLRELPPGHYAIESIEEDEELTTEERTGILEALADFEVNGGIPFEQVKCEFRQRY